MANENEFIKRARQLVLRRLRYGLPRKIAKEKGFIASLGTARDYCSCISNYLEWIDDNYIPVHEQDHRQHMVAYIQECAEIYSQSTLNQHRQALANLFQIKNIPQIRALKLRDYSSRSYTWSEVKQIIKHQNDKNSLSTLIAYSAGLRAHELVTLRLVLELPRSDRRAWRQDLFSGSVDSVIYVATGKGGLRRYVALPRYLSIALERSRCEPVTVFDRGIKYTKTYNINFGQAFSQSFTRASKKALGLSHGAHGLRHSYVKRRVSKLLELGYSLSDAMLVVSQEVGHFRPLITTCYMR
ncbi:hypothetical protein [Methylotenera sp. L2L1]|uniref:hypothetical protein n=1 Tax=Methylotenera sp. L2L1 TaxID=1502770 RepID=UPI00068D5555|nr:hypothetical protein [Methylotenera sp. L2L1]